MSEFELVTFLIRDSRNKANCGELFLAIPLGYFKAPTGKIIQEPDERTRGMIQLSLRSSRNSAKVPARHPSLASTIRYAIPDGRDCRQARLDGRRIHLIEHARKCFVARGVRLVTRELVT